MKILSIDPGTINCGYCILEVENKKPKLVEAGLIKMKSRILQEQIVEFIEGLDLVVKNHTISQVAMEDMFYGAKEFNQALNNWNVSNVTDMNAMFDKAIAFKMKFNNGNALPSDTNDLKVWFKENRDMMLAIDIKEREKDNLDSFYNNLEILYNNLDK